MSRHVIIARRPCSHQRYRLTCDQFDELREEAGNRCQICGKAGSPQTGDSLHIDHDAALGNWAVRGLLCSRCNSNLDNPCMAGARKLTYLANPWHRRLTAGSPSPRPWWLEECPPPERTVKDDRGRLWHPTKSLGWYVTSDARCKARTWADLVRCFGRHNLEILPVERDSREHAADIPKAKPGPKRRKRQLPNPGDMAKDVTAEG